MPAARPPAGRVDLIGVLVSRPRVLKRFRAVPLAAAALGLAVVISGCNAASSKDDGDGGGSGDKKSAGRKFVLITPDPLGQNDFLKLGAKGIASAAKAHDGSSKIYESKDATTREQNLQAAIADKPEVVAMVGFEFIDLLAKHAAANPKQQFLLVDACTAKPVASKNVTCAVFREHEAAYLAGAEAGLLTKGKVGAVGPIDTPQFRRFTEGFAAGAKKTRPKVSAKSVFVGGQSPFDDSARAKEQAASLITKGADQIMAGAVAGNFGIFEAAEAKGAGAYGVDSNQCPSSPGTVVDNVLKKTDVAVSKGIETILAKKGGGVASYGLKEGGMSLTGLEPGLKNSKCVIAKHPDVLKKIKDLRQQIADGKLKVADPAAAKK
jgi:basic membrane protein A